MNATKKKPIETTVSAPVTDKAPAPATMQNPQASINTQKIAQPPQTATQAVAQPNPQPNTQPTAGQNAQQSGSGGVGDIINLPGLSDQTKSTLGGLVANGYKPSQRVTEALANVQSVIDQQPAAFKSKHTESLDRLLDMILNREQFNYDMSMDPAYQAYRQMYMSQGKAAMEDTMGRAAALTGGYGSSYATTAGQQQYNQYLQQLNDRVPELQQMALDRYNAEGDRLAQQYGLLGDAYGREYGEWQDQYNRWLDERDFAQGRYDTERGFDYGQYGDSLANWMAIAGMEQDQSNLDRDFNYQQERDAVADQRYDNEWQYQQDRDALADRRYDDEWAYQKEQDALANQRYDTEWQYQKEQDALANQRYDTEWQYQKEQDALDNQRYDNEWAYQQEQDALANQRYDAEWAYQKEQDALANQRYDDERAYQKEQDALDRAEEDRDYAYDLAMDMLNQGKLPSRELLRQAGLSDADIETLLGGGGSSGGSSSGSKSNSGGTDKPGSGKTLPEYLNDTKGNANTKNKSDTGTKSPGTKNGTDEDKKKLQEAFSKFL